MAGDDDLREDQSWRVGWRRASLAWECSVSTCVSLQARVDQHLAERRLLGFKLNRLGHRLASFARHVANADHVGPLTFEFKANWARQASSQAKPSQASQPSQAKPAKPDRQIWRGV